MGKGEVTCVFGGIEYRDLETPRGRGAPVVLAVIRASSGRFSSESLVVDAISTDELIVIKVRVSMTMTTSAERCDGP